MANPYSTPLQYEYKPLDISVLAGPLANMQQQYDLTRKQLDDTLFELKSLSPDDTRAKEIKAALGQSVDNIAGKLLNTKDYKAAGRKLGKLNKFYNSNEEFKAIQSNYENFQKAIEEQKKRLTGKNADLTHDEYREWYTRQMQEFIDKKGTSYKDGDYNTIGTIGRLSNMDQEIEEWALKLLNATPMQQQHIIGEIEDIAGRPFQDQRINTLIEYKDKGQLTAEIYKQLSSSTRFQAWMDEKADYHHYFQSQGNPKYAAEKYGEILQNFDNQIESINNSKAKKSEKTRAIDEIEKQKKALEKGYGESKGDYIKSIMKGAWKKDYLYGVAESMGDIGDVRRVKYDVDILEDYAAKKAYDEAKDIALVNADMYSGGATTVDAEKDLFIGEDVKGIGDDIGKSVDKHMETIIGTHSTSEKNPDGEGYLYTPGTGLLGMEDSIKEMNQEKNKLTLEVNRLKREYQTKMNNASTKEEKVALKQEYYAIPSVRELGKIEEGIRNAKGAYNTQVNKVLYSTKKALENLRDKAIENGDEKSVQIYKDKLEYLDNNISTDWMSVMESRYAKRKGEKHKTITSFLEDNYVEGEHSFLKYSPEKYPEKYPVSNYSTDIRYTDPYNSKQGMHDKHKITRMPNEEDVKMLENLQKRGTLSDDDGRILHFNIGDKTKFGNESSEDYKNYEAWKKFLEDKGYTVTTTGSSWSNNDSRAYHHFYAVPNSLVEAQMTHKMNSQGNEGKQINKAIIDQMWQEQVNRTFNDDVINLTPTNITQLDKVTNNEVSNLLEFQKLDTNNNNTRRLRRNIDGSYELASEDKELEPNLALYEARGIEGITEIDGKTVTVVTYSPKKGLTDAQIVTELETQYRDYVSTIRDIGTMDAEQKRAYRAGLESYIDNWRENFAGQDISVGTFGTSINANAILKATDKTTRQAVRNFSMVQSPDSYDNIMNSIGTHAAMDIALDINLQKRLMDDIQTVYRGIDDKIEYVGEINPTGYDRNGNIYYGRYEAELVNDPINGLVYKIYSQGMSQSGRPIGERQAVSANEGGVIPLDGAMDKSIATLIRTQELYWGLETGPGFTPYSEEL